MVYSTLFFEKESAEISEFLNEDRRITIDVKQVKKHNVYFIKFLCTTKGFKVKSLGQISSKYSVNRCISAKFIHND